jgi:hypothetical protein
MHNRPKLGNGMAHFGHMDCCGMVGTARDLALAQPTRVVATMHTECARARHKHVVHTRCTK